MIWEIINDNCQCYLDRQEIETIFQGLEMLEQDIQTRLIKANNGDIEIAIEISQDSVCCYLLRQLKYVMNKIERGD